MKAFSCDVVLPVIDDSLPLIADGWLFRR